MTIKIILTVIICFRLIPSFYAWSLIILCRLWDELEEGEINKMYFMDSTQLAILYFIWN